MAAREEGPHKRQRLSEDAGSSEAAAAASAATDGQPAAAAATEQQQEQKRQQQRLVIIWDLDETLLIFNSLLTGTFAAAQRTLEAAERLQALGARWERAILGLCDGQFFFDQLETFDQTCLADVLKHDDGASLAAYDWQGDGFPPSSPQAHPHSREEHAAAARPAPYAAGEGSAAGAAPASPPASPVHALDAAAMRKLAYRYRRIVRLFTFGLQALGGAQERREWEDLFAATDAATGGWLSHADALLAGITLQLSAGSGAGGGAGSLPAGSEVAVEHVAVTSGQLIPSLAKLLLFRLSGHISAEHTWSSRYLGKEHCFELVRQRFGPECSYLVIGDGVEEDAAAATLGLPYVRVLLAPAEHYPADRVASWRPDATGGPGLPFTQLSVQHVVAAAGLAAAADGGLTEQGGDGALVGNKHGHGGTAALEALAASGGSGGAAGSDEGAGGTQRDQQAQSELGGA